ncbi:MAG: DUF2007 domain-containing protein [Chitinophagaceae bacterium]|nr:DUF2007 domain-containing protein [Chitinophagaceae bacterium]MBN8666426.1 DUF2007 domain-containing protein [Chitinophagales bacterium]
MAGSFIPVQIFTNYIDAHILLGRLESENIVCYLMDENTVTINPIWTQAVGGIKLMVEKSQVGRAMELIHEIQQEKKEKIICPKCGSDNIEYVSSPRKPANWIGAIFGFFLGDYPVTVRKVYHCFNCKHEFDPPVEN